MTRSLAAVERFLERLLERPAARLFRAPVQPVQIQRQLERAMEAGRVSWSDRTWVPDRFRVRLHPSDAAALEGERTRLETNLADAVSQHARQRGFVLVEQPEVLLLPAADVREGEVSVVADTLDPGVVRAAAAGLRTVELAGPRPPRPPRAPVPGTAPVASLAAAPPADVAALPTFPTDDAASGATSHPGTPAAVGPGRVVEVRCRDSQPWAVTVRGGVLRIGRGADNDIVLRDDRVSRRHGQLTLRQGMLVYTDLGSRNGTLVNGVPAREIALGTGDVVSLGAILIVVLPGG